MAEQNKNRWCCRIFPLVLILLSALIAAAIGYFDDDVHQILVVNSWSEFIHFAGSVLFIAILPIGLFYYLNDKEKFLGRAKLWALLGFLPALLFLVFLML